MSHSLTQAEGTQMGRKKTQADEAPEGTPAAQPKEVQPDVPGGAAQPQGQRDKPAHTVRIGRITGTVWRNEGKDGPWFSVAITRSYLDGQKQWKKAHTYGLSDLLTVAEIARLCWLFIAHQTGSALDGNGHGEHQSPSAHGSADPIPF